MVEIKWFEQLQRGKSATVEKSYILAFTLKPKGIRLNAGLTRALQEKNIEYVKLGLVGENVFVLSPSTKDEGGLRVSKGSKSSSAIISSGTVGAWVEQKGIATGKAVGEWDEEMGVFKFALDDLLREIK